LAEKKQKTKNKKQKTKKQKTKNSGKSWGFCFSGQDLGYLGYWKRISKFLKLFNISQIIQFHGMAKLW